VTKLVNKTVSIIEELLPPNTCLSPAEYRTIFRYRLMIPLFSIGEACHVCRKVCLDTFGEHTIQYKELPGFKYRHDVVRDILFDIFRRARISVKKEAHVNFMTNPLDKRSSLRFADVMVYRWVGGKHACVDLTGVSPLVGLDVGPFNRRTCSSKSCVKQSGQT